MPTPDQLSLALFAALQLADALTTRAIIKRGGFELNPLLRWLARITREFSGARWAWLVIGKGAAMAAFFVLVQLGAVHAQALAVLLYLVVVVHNWKTLKGMQNGKN